MQKFLQSSLIGVKCSSVSVVTVRGCFTFLQMLLDEVDGDISFKLSFEEERSDALDIEDLLED